MPISIFQDNTLFWAFLGHVQREVVSLCSLRDEYATEGKVIVEYNIFHYMVALMGQKKSNCYELVQGSVWGV